MFKEIEIYAFFEFIGDDNIYERRVFGRRVYTVYYGENNNYEKLHNYDTFKGDCKLEQYEFEEMLDVNALIDTWVTNFSISTL
jgi:hypothetical protein